MTGTDVLLVVFAVLAAGIYLVLSVAILSAVTLSRVSLHRLGTESDGRSDSIEAMGRVSSSYRLAAQAVRQCCLLASALLIGFLGVRAGWPNPWILGMVAAAVVVVIVLENMVARIIALRQPKVALRLLTPTVQAARWAVFPLVFPVEFILNRVTRPAPRSEEEKEEEQEEEVEAYIEVGEREGILEADEGKMMRSIVDMGDTRVREIMTPRTDIQALQADTRVGQARQALIQAGHSRMPVYRDGIDNVVGILHLRDLVQAWARESDEAKITPYLRQPFFVPETQMLSDLLAQLRTRTNMALVVDEYGGIAGLVTMEDILEEIVGDIRDEHDVEEDQITENADGSWTYSGLVRVEQLEENFGIEVEDRDFDTVGGMVVATLGRVPAQGENLEYEGLGITVVRADPRRVYKVRIRRRAVQPEPDA